jgi:serine/threonine protein kinase
MYVHGGELKGSGRIKLIDFGTACKMEKGGKLSDVYGSPNIMAPEVLKKNYDFKCDVWSIGVICCKLITGVMPFDAVSEAQLFKNIQHKTFDFKKYALDKNKSVHCIDFMKRTMYKDPRERVTAHDAFLHGWLWTRGRDPLERDKCKECLT